MGNAVGDRGHGIAVTRVPKMVSVVGLGLAMESESEDPVTVKEDLADRLATACSVEAEAPAGLVGKDERAVALVAWTLARWCKWQWVVLTRTATRSSTVRSCKRSWKSCSNA